MIVQRLKSAPIIIECASYRKLIIKGFFCFHRAIFNHPEQILVVFNFPREIKDVIINTDEIMTASDNSIKVCSFTYLYKRNLHKFVILKR